MKVKLLKDFIDYKAGRIIAVSESQGRRLIEIGVAKEIREPQRANNTSIKYQNKMMLTKE